MKPTQAPWITRTLQCPPGRELRLKVEGRRALYWSGIAFIVGAAAALYALHFVFKMNFNHGLHG